MNSDEKTEGLEMLSLSQRAQLEREDKGKEKEDPSTTSLDDYQRRRGSTTGSIDTTTLDFPDESTLQFPGRDPSQPSLEKEELEFKKVSVPVRKTASVKKREAEFDPDHIVLELGGETVQFEEDIYKELVPCEGSSLAESDGLSVAKLMEALKAKGSGLALGKKSFLGRKYTNAFYARELVSWLIAYLSVKDREIGVRVGDFLKSRGIIAQVLGDHHAFKDEKSPYRFVSDRLECPHFTITSVIALMEKIDLDPEMDVEDREYRRVIYTDCFNGSKLVTWITTHLPVHSRKEAVGLGNLLVKAGCIVHALKPHRPFEDKKAFFRLVPKPAVALSAKDFEDVIHVDKKQFLAYYKQVSPQSPAHQTERLFGTFDKNGDGFINFDEFLQGMGILRQGGEPLLKLLFESYDVERKGYIGEENLVELLKDTMAENNLRFKPEQLTELAELLIGKIDKKHTHQIDFPKFRAFFGLSPIDDARAFKWNKNDMLVAIETEAIGPAVEEELASEPEDVRNKKINKRFVRQFHLERIRADTLTEELSDLNLPSDIEDYPSSEEDDQEGSIITLRTAGPTLFVPPLSVKSRKRDGDESGSSSIHDPAAAMTRFISRAPVAAFEATDDWYAYNVADYSQPPEPKKHGLKRIGQLYNRALDYLWYRRKVILWLFVWAFLTAGFFVWRFVMFYYSSGFDLLGWSGCFSRGFAGMIYLNLPLMLVSMSRISFLTWLRGKFGDYFPFDYYINWHILAAYVNFGAALGHTGCHLNHFYIISHSTLQELNDALEIHLNDVPAYWELCFASVPGLTGILALVFMFIIITVSSIKAIRTYLHEWFYAVHYICFLPIFILIAIHGTQQFLGFPIFWCFLIIPFTIYFVEKLYRFLRLHFWNTDVLQIVKHPSNVMEFRMRKPRGFTSKMGQHVLINCPAVSFFQTHPFTLSSSPAEDYISVHIRKAGGWTTELHKIGETYIDRPSKLRVKVDGAFGAPYERIYKYRYVMLVAAGIGVTPFASVLKDLNIAKQSRKRRGKKLERAYFFWVNRDQQAFEWFAELLNEVGSSKRQNWLEINTYLTSAFQKQDIKSYLLWDALQKAYKKHKKDFVTGLHSNTFWGRPNWDEIFHQLKKLHSQNRIGVFFCGPPVVAKELSKWCRHYSRKGTTFDFHAELFN